MRGKIRPANDGSGLVCAAGRLPSLLGAWGRTWDRRAARARNGVPRRCSTTNSTGAGEALSDSQAGRPFGTAYPGNSIRIPEGPSCSGRDSV